MSFYKNNFGFRTPFQVLIDATFCFTALKVQNVKKYSSILSFILRSIPIPEQNSNQRADTEVHAGGDDASDDAMHYRRVWEPWSEGTGGHEHREAVSGAQMRPREEDR